MLKIFGKKKKEKKEEKVDLSRRNFMKGAAIIPAGVVVATTGKAVASSSPKVDYLKKTWVEEGITYKEYELPEHIQPFFKHPEGRGRAISVPIYNLGAETNLTEKGYTKKLKNYIEMHQREDENKRDSVDGSDHNWDNPYCYIIRVKGHPELFGGMINQQELEFENSVYTVYG